MRRLLIAVLVVLLSGLAAPLVAAPVGPAAVEECRAEAPGDFERGCRSAEQVVWGLAAECRRRGGTNCDEIDGRDIGPHRMAAYRGSWVDKALALQRGLDASKPLWEQQIVHTHNSFNSSSYDPTLTNQDPNQVYGLVDQLDMGVRFLELDLHWVPSVHGRVETGGNWVTLCHGNSGIVPGIHAGCTNDRPLQDGLAEIRAWLDSHPGEFLYLYLENQLGSQQGHDVAASLLGAAFPGKMVYKPTTECGTLPYAVSRSTMLAAGARLVLVGNCGAGAWGRMVHQRGPAWNEGGDPTDYDTADCGADVSARLAHANFRRYFMDSTWLTAMVSGASSISPATARMMTACGVNMIGFDQLTPDDGRLEALVWSWTEAELAAPAGTCAVQTGAARFGARGCASPLRYACLDGAGAWRVTAASGPWSGGAAACAAEFPGSSFSVPWNGLRNTLLANEHSDEVWLDYAVVAGQWKPEASG